MELKFSEEVLYTIADVAKILKVHERTIRRYIKKGELKAGKTGKRYYISGKALKDFLVKKGVL